MLIIREIVHSCSNDHVAQAALNSIGGSFAARIEALAEQEGVPSGAYAASMVARFDEHASDRDWAALRHAVRACDQPVLIGLRHILERALARPHSAPGVGAFSPIHGGGRGGETRRLAQIC